MNISEVILSGWRSDINEDLWQNYVGLPSFRDILENIFKKSILVNYKVHYIKTFLPNLYRINCNKKIDEMLKNDRQGTLTTFNQYLHYILNLIKLIRDA